VLYFWRILEPKEGEYDFSVIENDLVFYQSIGKKFFLQLQDRNFSTKWGMALPAYLFNDKKYGGAMVPQWDNKGEGFVQKSHLMFLFFGINISKNATNCFCIT